MKRGLQIALFWLRAAVFGAILLGVMTWSVYVLTPKHDYGICPIVNLYEQPDHTVDVLVLGTSLGYAGVNTNVLWEEYGIAAYDLCGAEQPFWVSRFYLEEALKTQSPKLIILDAKASTYTQEYSKRGRTILSTFGIRDLGVRLRAIQACVSAEDFWSFAIAWPQIHTNYKDVTADHFVYPPDNGGRGSDWKGYIESTETEQHEKPSLVWAETRVPMQARQRQYLEEMLTIANEAGIPVLVIGIPNPDYANDHLYYNDLFAVAQEYGAQVINYNDPDLRVRLTYSSDFADWQHLNVKGSVKLSRRLGSDLMANYDLPDRRGDERYISYDICAEHWYEKFPEYHPDAEE